MAPTVHNDYRANRNSKGKPAPLDLNHHLSATARRRKANIYKLFYKYYEIPGIQDISGGLPHPSLFPFEELSGLACTPLDHKSFNKVSAHHDEVSNALQYGQVTGMPEMDTWIKEFTHKYIATPQYSGEFGTLLTGGSTDGWNKALQVLSNEWRDTDPIAEKQGVLVEEFTYSLAAEVAKVRGLNIVGVEMDSDGMKPQSLEKVLSSWDCARGQRPHLMYTVSIGQNPTGATVPQQRRREIYRLCREYDVIIVEDEPYWFMQYESDDKCYLECDVDGRVLRLDSFSKSFAPGCRMGWVTGQPELVRRIYYHGEESTQQPSGFSQLMVYKTLSQWTYEGWMQWLHWLKDEYRERRDMMVSALAEFKFAVNGEQVIDFKPPVAGMFLWLTMRFDLHPAASRMSLSELSRAFWIHGTKYQRPYLINPGCMFAPNLEDTEHLACNMRMSFAPCDKEAIAPAAASVGMAAREFWHLEESELREMAAAYPN